MANDSYLKTKVLTASPEQLRLMLFDGAIKFCRQARHALSQKNYETLYTALVRAQKIVLELGTSLNRKVDPALCDKLTALYNYLYRRLVDANLERDVAAIDECLRLLEFERETWALLMKRLQDDRAAGRDSVADARNDLEKPQNSDALDKPLARIGSSKPFPPAQTASSGTLNRLNVSG